MYLFRKRNFRTLMALISLGHLKTPNEVARCALLYVEVAAHCEKDCLRSTFFGTLGLVTGSCWFFDLIVCSGIGLLCVTILIADNSLCYVYSNLRQKFCVVQTRTLYPTFLADDTDLAADKGWQSSLGRQLFTQRCYGFYILGFKKSVGTWRYFLDVLCSINNLLRKIFMLLK